MPDPIAPAASIVPVTGGFYGLGLGGQGSWLFGSSTNIARGPGPEQLHYTVIPLPVLPPGDLTMQRRAEAFAATYAGRLEDAVDLYRLTVEADGWMNGILFTMAHGILGLPLQFLGDPQIVSALLDADGTPSDFAKMHPENECAKIFADGLGMGLGLGQYLLMCWRCGETEWELQNGGTDAHVDVETCKRCRARRIDRPAGTRELFQLRWRDPRWLWRNTVTGQWYYTGRHGMVPVNPGDGEWFMFRTVPDCDVWRHGPWIYGTIAAIFARDSTFDRQNTSAVCAPTHVFKATGNTGPGTRQDVERQAEQLRWGNKLMLPGEWEHRIDAAKAEFVDVTDSIVTWASTMWEVGLTGNAHGMKAATGFANMDVFARATRERRAFYAAAWIRQIGEQGLTWYCLDNWGHRNAPVGKYDPRSPEDKLKDSEALEAEGKALKALRDGYDAVGAEIDLGWVVERAQAKGVRVKPKAGNPSTAKLSLGDQAIMAAVRGGPALDSLGLERFGDERDNMTLAALANQAKAGGGPAPAAPTGAPPPSPAPSPPGPPPPAGRLEAEDDDECDGEDAARLAAEMTAHGYDRCYHGRTHTCPRCGVRAVYGAGPPATDGKPTYRVTWRALRGRLGSVARPSGSIERAEAELDAALAVLEALGPEEDDKARLRAQYNPDQPRGADGKFGAGGGGGGKHDLDTSKTRGAQGRSKAAAQARRDSKDARLATFRAKVGHIGHDDAAKEHDKAEAQNREAAARSRSDAHRAAHLAVAAAHAKLAAAHREAHAAQQAPKPLPAAPKPPPKTPAAPAPATATPPSPPAAPAPLKTQPLNISPAALSADVKAKIAGLPKAHIGGSSVEVLNGTKVAQDHIDKVLPKLSTDEKHASQKFSNGHDYEMRALERGVSKDDLVKSRMAKGATEKEARAHVEASAKMLPEFHAALEKLKTTTPPPPPLYRGMGVSERTLHELLTKNEYDTAGMSSSASLSEHVATGFADSNRGRKDYRGDLMTHAVVLVIHKATSAPIMHSELSDYGEREQVLPREGKYRVTKRERDTSGRIAIHLEEV